MAQSKFVYIILGGVITIAGLALSMTLLLPTQAANVQGQSSNEIFVPVISSIDDQGQVITSSIEQNGSGSKSKITVPIVPTERPSNIKPTSTPIPGGPPSEAPGGPPGGRNTPIEGDLSPEVLLEDKWSIVLKYPDGRRAKFLMAAEKVEGFLSSQPEGVTLATSAPPASLMGNIPPTPITDKHAEEIATPFVDTPPSDNIPRPPNYNN